MRGQAAPERCLASDLREARIGDLKTRIDALEDDK
jgi:hypothetical protein